MKNVIGLDIGASKITGIVFDGRKVVKAITNKTPKNLAGFKAGLLNLVNDLSAGKKVAALGIGMAGMMDSENHLARSSPNIKFVKNLNFRKLFPKIKKLALENDANCFALAEARLGLGKKFKNFIGITLGTGIGGGLISRNQIYRGIHGVAGEVGHMMADSNHSYEFYFQKARGLRDYKAISKIVASIIINIARVIDCEAIIFGGSVAQNAYKKFLPAVKRLVYSKLKPDVRPKVFVSKLKNAGALGAVLLLE
ncbi:MAG: ROK family protein [Patescibacteria group bacterium]